MMHGRRDDSKDVSFSPSYHVDFRLVVNGRPCQELREFFGFDDSVRLLKLLDEVRILAPRYFQRQSKKT